MNGSLDGLMASDVIGRARVVCANAPRIEDYYRRLGDIPVDN